MTNEMREYSPPTKVSGVSFQVSGFRCQFFFIQSCGASWLRVWYQQGLPRLVFRATSKVKTFFLIMRLYFKFVLSKICLVYFVSHKSHYAPAAG